MVKLIFFLAKTQIYRILKFAMLKIQFNDRICNIDKDRVFLFSKSYENIMKIPASSLEKVMKIETHAKK